MTKGCEQEGGAFQELTAPTAKQASTATLVDPRRRPVLKSGFLPMYIIPTYLENPKAPPDQS